MASAEGILIAVRINGPEAQFLEFVADRGGEISWDWEKCRPDVTAMVTGLISSEKRLIADLRAERRIRLTDQGRSAVSQIKHAKKHARIVGA